MFSSLLQHPVIGRYAWHVFAAVWKTSFLESEKSLSSISLTISRERNYLGKQWKYIRLSIWYLMPTLFGSGLEFYWTKTKILIIYEQTSSRKKSLLLFVEVADRGFSNRGILVKFLSNIRQQINQHLFSLKSSENNWLFSEDFRRNRSCCFLFEFADY